MGSKPRKGRECVAACSFLTACAMTQPLPPRDPSPWPDTFAAGSASAHAIPLRRSWDTLAEDERQTAARRVRDVQVEAAFADRDVLLSQLPCMMPVPAPKLECTKRTQRASLRISR